MNNTTVLGVAFAVGLLGVPYIAAGANPGIGGGVEGPSGPTTGSPESGAGSGIAPGTTPGQSAPGGDIGRTPGLGSRTTPGSKSRPGESNLGIERGPLPPASSTPPDSGIPPPPTPKDGQG